MIRRFLCALLSSGVIGCREPPVMPDPTPASQGVGELVQQLSDQVHLRDVDRLRHAADLADYGLLVIVLGGVAAGLVLFLVVALVRLAVETRRRRTLGAILRTGPASPTAPQADQEPGDAGPAEN